MSRNIKVWAEVEVHLAADEVAEVFWDMDAEEQAGFFNRLGELAQERLAFQIQAIINNPHLDHNGVYAIRTFSGYGEIVSINDCDLDNDELKHLRRILKSGEYDGADLMKAWLALDELIELREWRDKAFQAHAPSPKLVVSDA